MAKPHFTDQQLIEIYETANRSLDIQVLRGTAQKLYPDTQEPDGRPPLFLHEGAGRGFLVNGEYQHATHTIASRMNTSVGILPDGTPVPF